MIFLLAKHFIYIIIKEYFRLLMLFTHIYIYIHGARFYFNSLEILKPSGEFD